MSYSQGVAPFYDLFDSPGDPPNEAATFLLSLAGRARSVLDIGAGTGATALALARNGLHVTALEPDPEMFAMLLARVGSKPEIRERVTPVPKGTGFNTGMQYDIVSCFSVLHLLDAQSQEALVGYAATAIKRTGRVVLHMPVITKDRTAKPLALVGSRQLGRLQVEHHSATEQAADRSWRTHWRFVCLLGEECVLTIDRIFAWAPLSHDRSSALLASSGLTILEEYAGYDQRPYVPGHSTVRLVVAGAA